MQKNELGVRENLSFKKAKVKDDYVILTNFKTTFKILDTKNKFNSIGILKDD